MSQQVRRGTVEAVFSRRSAENQFRPGLFPGRKRLVAVLGDGSVQVHATKPATMTPFRKDLTTDGTDGTDESRVASNKLPSVKSVKSVVQLLSLRTSKGSRTKADFLFLAACHSRCAVELLKRYSRGGQPRTSSAPAFSREEAARCRYRRWRPSGFHNPTRRHAFSQAFYHECHRFLTQRRYGLARLTPQPKR